MPPPSGPPAPKANDRPLRHVIGVLSGRRGDSHALASAPSSCFTARSPALVLSITVSEPTRGCAPTHEWVTQTPFVCGLVVGNTHASLKGAQRLRRECPEREREWRSAFSDLRRHRRRSSGSVLDLVVLDRRDRSSRRDGAWCDARACAACAVRRVLEHELRRPSLRLHRRARMVGGRAARGGDPALGRDGARRRWRCSSAEPAPDVAEMLTLALAVQVLLRLTSFAFVRARSRLPRQVLIVGTGPLGRITGEDLTRRGRAQCSYLSWPGEKVPEPLQGRLLRRVRRPPVGAPARGVRRGLPLRAAPARTSARSSRRWEPARPSACPSRCRPTACGWAGRSRWRRKAVADGFLHYVTGSVKPKYCGCSSGSWTSSGRRRRCGCCSPSCWSSPRW